MKKYHLNVRRLNFITMQVERVPELSKAYRWKWVGKLHEIIINTAPRSYFGMFVANLEEQPR
jgi:hypothetical protein